MFWFIFLFKLALVVQMTKRSMLTWPLWRQPFQQLVKWHHQTRLRFPVSRQQLHKTRYTKAGPESQFIYDIVLHCIVFVFTLFSLDYCFVLYFSQPAGLKRAGSPSETEKASKKARVDDKEITVCYLLVTIIHHHHCHPPHLHHCHRHHHCHHHHHHWSPLLVENGAINAPLTVSLYLCLYSTLRASALNLSRSLSFPTLTTRWTPTRKPWLFRP